MNTRSFAPFGPLQRLLTTLALPAAVLFLAGPSSARSTQALDTLAKANPTNTGADLLDAPNLLVTFAGSVMTSTRAKSIAAAAGDTYLDWDACVDSLGAVIDHCMYLSVYSPSDTLVRTYLILDNTMTGTKVVPGCKYQGYYVATRSETRIANRGIASDGSLVYDIDATFDVPRVVAFKYAYTEVARLEAAVKVASSGWAYTYKAYVLDTLRATEKGMAIYSSSAEDACKRKSDTAKGVSKAMWAAGGAALAIPVGGVGVLVAHSPSGMTIGVAAGALVAAVGQVVAEVDAVAAYKDCMVAAGIAAIDWTHFDPELEIEWVEIAADWSSDGGGVGGCGVGTILDLCLVGWEDTAEYNGDGEVVVTSEAVYDFCCVAQ